MSKHVIYYFSGTGNCYNAAKVIAEALGDCAMIPMGNSKEYHLEGGYESIGFVYPTYFRGEPKKVTEFITKLDLSKNKKTYYYAVTACGKYEGNALAHIKNILKKKDITLNFGQKLNTFSNYVIVYNMRDSVAEETEQTDKELLRMIGAIQRKETNKIKATEPLQEAAYRILTKFISNMDKNYNVSDDCTGCGICQKICPVNNITLGSDKKPIFHHTCEQCVACIQYCPKRAINYKDKTQNRGRYTHPNVPYRELAKSNHL